MHTNKKAFTLVELIVIVSILAILSTVAFVSYSNYLSWARDSNRLTQLVSIHDWLEVYSVKRELPLPGSNIRIQSDATGSVVLWYQWYVWADILEWISFNKGWLDPKDNTYFTYYLTKDKKAFQVLGYLEEQVQNTEIALVEKSNAAVDYTERYPVVFWKKLWILTEDVTWAPIQEVSNIITAWYLNISDVWTVSYTAHLSDTEKVTGTGSSLLVANTQGSCKRLKDVWTGKTSGYYSIYPDGSTPIGVYCDMNVDGGGWTLIGRSVAAWSSSNFGYAFSDGVVTDDTVPYSYGLIAARIFYFREVLFWSYTKWKNISTNIYKKEFLNNFSYYGSIWENLATTIVQSQCLPSQLTGIAYMWHTVQNGNFFLWSSSSYSWSIWLTASWFLYWVWCAAWNLETNQGMILVR